MSVGIHHVCIKAVSMEKLEESIYFYNQIIGMPIFKIWKGGAMLGDENGKVELFANGTTNELGVINHLAIGCDDVDELVERIRQAGYAVTNEPKDIDMPTDPVFPIRMAFVTGPNNERIEIFHER